MRRNALQPGDWVVYRRTKYSETPGPRAHDVSPTRGGDMYSYVVDKFWVVSEIDDEGQLLLRTRTGKTHRVKPNDPNLRRPTWWERFRFGERFRDASTDQRVAS